jgi:hypothetical protein
MKSCPKEEVLQMWLDGELTADADAAMREHLASCSQCARALQEIEQAFAAMGDAFAIELPDAVPTARLRARIESALAEEAAPRWAWSAWFGHLEFWRIGWATAMLLLAGLIAWAWLGRYSTQLPHEARHETPAPTPSAPETKPQLARQSPPLRTRVRQRAIRAVAQDAEVVTKFYPLREGEDLTALARMQWVRVELPSSALSEVGLPVAPDAVTTRVKADVALGEDGLARAIRFVR